MTNHYGSLFDAAKYLLAPLCENGHDYQGTGQSLCYRSNPTLCLDCDKERARIYRQQNREVISERRRKKRAETRRPQIEAEAARLQAEAELLIQHGLDPSEYRLSPLCKNKHDWQRTGKTLRRIKTGHCLECEREKRNSLENQVYRAEYYQANHTRLLDQKKDYYQRNRDRKLAKDKEYREANPEKIAARNKLWYEQNRDKQIQYGRDRYVAKRDEILIEKRRYSKSNRPLMRLRWNRWRSTPTGRAADNRSKAKRKALKLANHRSDFSVEQWLERVAEFDQCCAYCGSQTALAQDHLLPVSMGGSDTIGNLIPVCRSCNSSKGNRDPMAWYKAQSFFAPSRWRKILKVLGKTEANYNQIPLL